MLQVSKDLSAIQSGLQRNVTTFVGKSLGMVAFSQILSANWTGETVPALPRRRALPPFSLKGPWAIRFQRLRQANAMRSQIDDVAKPA